MKIHEVTQNTDAWLRARAGIPTASEFDNLVTAEWKPRTGQMPESYLYRKLAEKCMGIPLQTGGGWASEQGSILEHEALPWFMFEHDVEIARVGFVTTDDGRIGCSPDGLVGEDGGIECKCPQPDTHLRYLLGGVVPKEYLPQIHGSLFVTGRAWWTFMSYSRQFPPFVVRVERDEKIMDALRAALDSFLAKFDEAFLRISAIKAADNAVKEAAHLASSGEPPRDRSDPSR